MEKEDRQFIRYLDHTTKKTIKLKRFYKNMLPIHLPDLDQEKVEVSDEFYDEDPSDQFELMRQKIDYIYSFAYQIKALHERYEKSIDDPYWSELGKKIESSTYLNDFLQNEKTIIEDGFKLFFNKIQSEIAQIKSIEELKNFKLKISQSLIFGSLFSILREG